jgi:hypothetical protein
MADADCDYVYSSIEYPCLVDPNEIDRAFRLEIPIIPEYVIQGVCVFDGYYLLEPCPTVDLMPDMHFCCHRHELDVTLALVVASIAYREGEIDDYSGDDYLYENILPDDDEDDENDEDDDDE